MGAGLREGRDLPAVPGAGVFERPRVGQAAGAAGRARVHQPRQRLPGLRRSCAAPGDLRWARAGRRAALLRPVAGASALATDDRRPDGWLRASAEHLAARSQSHPGVRPAGPGPPLLRGGDPREPRPRPPRSHQPAVPQADHPPHAGPSARLPDPGHHHRDRAQPARRVQAHRRQAVLQGGTGAPDRDHHQRPDRLPVQQGPRDPPPVAGHGRPDQRAGAHRRARQPRLLA